MIAFASTMFIPVLEAKSKILRRLQDFSYTAPVCGGQEKNEKKGKNPRKSAEKKIKDKGRKLFSDMRDREVPWYVHL
jgi:hypothetical protein